jgi:hypothetical protein
VLSVLRGGLGLDALQVCFEDFVDGARRVRDVRSVTRSYRALVQQTSSAKTFTDLYGSLAVWRDGFTYGICLQLAQGFATEQY